MARQSNHTVFDEYLPPGTNSSSNAVFTGAVDAQLLDIDNDGVAEVLVDDAGKTTIWKWDGARFAPR